MPKTITTTGIDFNLQPGDLIRIADTRPWHLKLWHWITRRQPQLEFRVVDPPTHGVVRIEPAHKRVKE